MCSLLVATVVLLGAVKSPAVDACAMPAGWRPSTLVELVEGAQEVLYASVRHTYPDQTGLHWRRNLYTAEVDVYCIMKGQRTPSILNITDVGTFLLAHSGKG